MATNDCTNCGSCPMELSLDNSSHDVLNYIMHIEMSMLDE